MELNQAFIGQKIAYNGKQYEIQALGTTPSGGGLAWLKGVTSPAPLCDVEPMLEHVPLFARKDEPEKCPGMAEYGHGLTTTIVHAGCCDENGQRLKKAPQGIFKTLLDALNEYAHDDQFVNLPPKLRRELAGSYQLECLAVPQCRERAREAIYESRHWDAIVRLVGEWTMSGAPEIGELLLRTLATAITEYHAPAIQRIFDEAYQP